MLDASSTTWLFVSTSPEGVTIIPVPGRLLDAAHAHDARLDVDHARLDRRGDRGDGAPIRSTVADGLLVDDGVLDEAGSCWTADELEPPPPNAAPRPAPRPPASKATAAAPATSGRRRRWSGVAGASTPAAPPNGHPPAGGGVMGGSPPAPAGAAEVPAAAPGGANGGIERGIGPTAGTGASGAVTSSASAALTTGMLAVSPSSAAAPGTQDEAAASGDWAPPTGGIPIVGRSSCVASSAGVTPATGVGFVGGTPRSLPAASGGRSARPSQSIVLSAPSSEASPGGGRRTDPSPAVPHRTASRRISMPDGALTSLKGSCGSPVKIYRRPTRAVRTGDDDDRRSPRGPGGRRLSSCGRRASPPRRPRAGVPGGSSGVTRRPVAGGSPQDQRPLTRESPSC